VIHLLVVQFRFQELILLSDLRFVTHTPSTPAALKKLRRADACRDDVRVRGRRVSTRRPARVHVVDARVQTSNTTYATQPSSTASTRISE
jgi:hypothetical protein